MGAASLVYGEITFDSFAIILEKIKKRYGKAYVGTSGADGIMQAPGGTFYDLGSGRHDFGQYYILYYKLCHSYILGSGKCVIAACIMHNFEVCHGIELLDGLFTLSMDMKSVYGSLLASTY